MKFVKGVVCGYLLAAVLVPKVKSIINRRLIPATKRKITDVIEKNIENLLYGDKSKRKLIPYPYINPIQDSQIKHNDH